MAWCSICNYQKCEKSMLTELTISESIFQMPTDQGIAWDVWLPIYDDLNTPIRECVWIEYTDVVEFVLESKRFDVAELAGSST